MNVTKKIKIRHFKKGRKEATVVQHSNGFRTLILEGTLNVPTILAYSTNLQKIISIVGLWFSGLFPFLNQKGHTHIDTYTLHSTCHSPNKKTSFKFDYQYVFSISDSAINTASEDAAQMVLTKTELLEATLLAKLNEEAQELEYDEIESG